MLDKCVLTILELNWNQHLGHKKIKLNLCHHMLTSSTQLQNRSIHVVERTRTSSKCQKMKNARAKRAKILFFIVKYANLWGFCCRRRRGFLSFLVINESRLWRRGKNVKSLEKPLALPAQSVGEKVYQTLEISESGQGNNCHEWCSYGSLGTLAVEGLRLFAINYLPDNS